MNEQSANSYDLIQAQQLLNLIVSKQGSSAKEIPAPQMDTPKYSSLSAIVPTPRIPQAGKTDEGPSAAESEKDEPVLEDFDSWEGCIAWCMAYTRAEAAFVVDSQGFVIASRGRIPSQGFEGAGAELICSIEQLERIAPDAGTILCMDVDFDKRRIVGFVASSESTPPYVVGLVAPEPLRFDMKQKMIQQIVNNLPNLD
jgi:hypothetical protein